jgi:hypothetical protein
LPKFFNNRRTHRSSGSEKVWKLTPSPSPRDRRALIVARNPSAVSGTSMRYSPFIWDTSLLGLRANPFQKAARVLHPGNLHRGFVTPLPWGNEFLHLGARGSGADRRAAHWPGHVTGCPGRGAPLCCFLRSNRYRQRASTLGCELGRPTWLVECGGVRDQVSASSGA